MIKQPNKAAQPDSLFAFSFLVILAWLYRVGILVQGSKFHEKFSVIKKVVALLGIVALGCRLAATPLGHQRNEAKKER